MPENDNMPGKEYIGDGVYIQMENGMIKLTAENGMYVTDTIYLEPIVWRSMKNYVRRVNESQQDSLFDV